MKPASVYKMHKIDRIEKEHSEILSSIQSALDNRSKPNGIIFLQSNGEYNHGITDSVVFWEIVEVLEHYGYKIGMWEASRTVFLSNV